MLHNGMQEHCALARGHQDDIHTPIAYVGFGTKLFCAHSVGPPPTCIQLKQLHAMESLAKLLLSPVVFCIVALNSVERPHGW